MDYYTFLATSGLTGYDINKKTGHKELKIYQNEWDQMLNTLPDKAELCELNQKQFDTKSIINRVKAHIEPQFDFQVIRTGQKSTDS